MNIEIENKTNIFFHIYMKFPRFIYNASLIK